uniref:Prothoracicotropic hormone n=1 Tax=Cacopsylla melanoneura TaxID=428564 RepID=A0A8D8TKE8_9HEMI
MFFLGLRLPMLNTALLIHLFLLLVCFDELLTNSNCMAQNSNCLIEKIFHSFEDSSSLYYLKKRNEATVNHVYQSRNELPSCSCQSIPRLSILDNSHYPRQLLTLECVQAKCWHGFYECKPKWHMLKLLKRRSSDYPEDNNLPESLRNDWISFDFNVTISCECMP